MKKAKGPKVAVSKAKKAKVTAEQYEKDEVSSDDELPEVVSNATMKSNQEEVIKQLEHLKQQLRHAEKAKRREKQERFIAQKKKKRGHEEAAVTKEEKDAKEGEAPPPKRRPTKKVYPDLNITVEPLTKIHDTRASAALDFKSKRLAKVPRESVKTAVISYQKKLSVRK